MQMSRKFDDFFFPDAELPEEKNAKSNPKGNKK